MNSQFKFDGLEVLGDIKRYLAERSAKCAFEGEAIISQLRYDKSLSLQLTESMERRLESIQKEFLKLAQLQRSLY